MGQGAIPLNLAQWVRNLVSKISSKNTQFIDATENPPFWENMEATPTISPSS